MVNEDTEKQISITEPYENRHAEFIETTNENGWQFKFYTITHKSNKPPDETTISIAKQFAKDCIEKYRYIADSYGVGYIIVHNGMNANFIEINWWVGENMICTHTFLAQINNPYLYLEITHTGMNVCVWDALIHFHERNAWVKFVLENTDCPDIKSYLEDIYKN